MIFSFAKSKQTGAKLTGGVFFFASFLFAQAKRTEVLPKVKTKERAGLDLPLRRPKEKGMI